jgi:GTP-binding protein Era
VILAVNKVDNVQEKRSAAAPAVPRQPDELPRYRADLCGNRGNVDTIAIVRKHLPEAIHHFPEDYITDRSQRFMA